MVKFLNVFDKYKFTKSLKNLESYNEKRRSENSNLPYVYETKHLPKNYNYNKGNWFPSVFRDARRNQRRIMWKLISSEYCLLVDNKRVHLPDSDKSDSDTSTDSEK